MSAIERRCLICARPVAAHELLQHLTGDYHNACFASIAAAGVRVERWMGDGARCHLCRAHILAHAVVVRPAQLVVHLACFFTPPSASRASLGAAAWGQTPREVSDGLRKCSMVLRRMSERAQARAYALRARYHAARRVRL